MEPTEIEQICTDLREHSRMRAFAIKERIRGENACGAFIRRLLGWKMSDDEDERRKACARAQALVARIEADEVLVDELPARVADIARAAVHAMVMARAPWENIQRAEERALVKLVRELPVWDGWARDVKGLGEVSLAMVLGETGDLGNYANPAKVWKRMGLAPKIAYAMVMKNGELGYPIPKQRRSLMWNIGKSIIRAKQYEPVYYALYVERKALEAERYPDKTDMGGGKLMTPGWRDNRAQRWMVKKLLADLWAAWIAANVPVEV